MKGSRAHVHRLWGHKGGVKKGQGGAKKGQGGAPFYLALE